MNKLTTISIGRFSFNNSKIYDVSNLLILEVLIIGNDIYRNVSTFTLNGLKSLTTLSVGSNSFTHKPYWYGNDKSKSFHILNYESLKSIQIGEYSFSDFAGDFELKNLPQLQSIQIGTIERVSNNFFSSSFVIRGIDMMMNI